MNAPIVTNMKWQSWPFTHVPEEVVTGLRNDHAARSRAPTFAKALECFLQVRGYRPLSRTCLTDGELLGLFPEFVGAVYSTRLFGSEVSLQARYNYVRSLYVLLETTNVLPECVTRLYPRVGQAPAGIGELIAAFEDAPINAKAARIWNGWPVWSSTGHRQWLPLRTLFERLGAEWTSRLYQTLLAFSRGTRQQAIPGFTDLCKFIEQRREVTAETLRDRSFCTTLWQDFWVFYLKEKGSRGTHRNAVDKWRNNVRSFVQRVLIGSGLFAAPYGQFPGPWSRHGSLNSRGTEPVPADEVEGTLLVDVPDDISDEKAWQFLLVEIPRTVDAIETWALRRMDHLWSLYRRRKKLAHAALFPGNGATSNVPEEMVLLAAASTMYEAFGHPTDLGADLRSWYPQPVDSTAEALGVPGKSAFLPFAALLVIEHPSITGAFLDEFEMWDKNGKLVGLQTENGVTYLRGYKPRRGRWLAEMHIPLTRKSLRVVQRVLALTKHLRAYLRDKGKDQWRYLFLNARSFGHPLRSAKLTAIASEKKEKEALSRALHKAGEGNVQWANNVAERFSLKALRTTCGLRVFVNTHSEKRVSEALGHAEFDRNLLARYLPPTLVAFFQARWVRAFQAGMLSVILESSKHRLRAVGLTSEKALAAVFETANIQAMREMLRPDAPTHSETDEGEGKLLFEASTSSFRFVIAASCSAPVTGEEIFWHEFSKHLLGFMKSRKGLDPEIDACLREAEVQ